MKIAIVIPARYASSRFPGKPLALIGGQSMLSRVVAIAKSVSDHVCVATEDQRIKDHADQIGVSCVLTSDQCKTGSDRVFAAIRKMRDKPDFVINFQGDAPFTPPEALKALIDAFTANPKLEVVTPVVPLTWDALDDLREAKKTTPFSGTSCVADASGRALWFSKNILPAIRKEDRATRFSPVLQHVGLYGFRTDILARFVALPEGIYERLEGLEQLRLIENGIAIQTVRLNLDLERLQAGIDSPEDLIRAEKMLV